MTDWLNGKFSYNLKQYTASRSNYETSRRYISLSRVHLREDEMINEYMQGFPSSMEIQLKCYKGYQMERDLLARIKQVYGDRITTGASLEIEAFDGLVKGHPDFKFDDYPGDCKSVAMDEWLPKPDGKLPKRIYFQLQAYMLYSKKDRAIVVFESRQSGLIEDFWLKENPRVQELIHNRLQAVVNELKGKLNTAHEAI